MDHEFTISKKLFAILWYQFTDEQRQHFFDTMQPPELDELKALVANLT